MAYDGAVAARVRAVLQQRDDVVERKMMGGIAFMCRGNMCCGVDEESLMLRLSPETAETALREPHVRQFDKTGRPMRDWVLVGPEGIATDEALVGWVAQGVAFAESLPAK